MVRTPGGHWAATTRKKGGLVEGNRQVGCRSVPPPPPLLPELLPPFISITCRARYNTWFGDIFLFKQSVG
jgi:hypothetical protein